MDIPYPDKYYEVVKYFEYVVGDVETTTELDDGQRLLFYALRQQAEKGPCTSTVPPFWHLTDRHKHLAWSRLGKMTTFEAMVHFVRQFETILMDASSQTSINWRERFDEMAKDCANRSAGEPDQHGQISSNIGTNPSTGGMPPSSSAPDVLSSEHHINNGSAKSTSTRADVAQWDADLAAHTAPTLENIIFLANEAMKARRELQSCRGELQTLQHDTLASGTAKSGIQPVIHSALTTSNTELPPCKPTWLPEQSGNSVKVIPPPMQLTAYRMTEAAVHQRSDLPPFSHPTHDAAAGTSQRSASGWFWW